MNRICLLAAVTAGVLFASITATAAAEVRTAAINDRRDATLHQNVDGTSYRDPYDLKAVSVTYDDAAGSIAVALKFFDPLPSVDTFAAPSYALEVGERDDFGSCEAQVTGDLTIAATVPPDASDPSESQTHGPVAQITVSGYEGVIDAAHTISPDRLSVIVSAQLPVLAGRSFNCISEGKLQTNSTTFDEHDGGPLLGPNAITSCKPLTQPNYYSIHLSVRRSTCITALRLYRSIQERKRFPRGTFPRSYNHFGHPFKQAGFSCRYAIRGLAGTEWDLRCEAGRSRVWIQRRQDRAG